MQLDKCDVRYDMLPFTMFQLNRSNIRCHLLLAADVYSIVQPIRSHLSFSRTYRTLDNIAGTKNFLGNQQERTSSSCKLGVLVNIRYEFNSSLDSKKKVRCQLSYKKEPKSNIMKDFQMCLNISRRLRLSYHLPINVKGVLFPCPFKF